LGAGSVFYIGYRIKKKADQIQQAYKSNDLGKTVEALGGKAPGGGGGGGAGGGAGANAPPPSFPDWSQAASSGGEQKVPLRKGLTVVTAIAQTTGDYESIKQIDSASENAVHITYEADNVPNPFEGLADPKNQRPGASKGNSVRSERTILRQDLRNAHEYMQLFGEMGAEEYPGTTAITTSAVVLSDLKTKGESDFIYRAGGLKGMIGGLVGLLGQSDKQGAGGSKEADDLASVGKVNCKLQRAGQNDLAFPVLLNDQPVKLPAVHATCKSEDEEADFYFLDDADNPLALTWSFGGSKDRLQVIKIAYPPEMGSAAGSSSGGGGGSQIQEKLKTEGRIEVYGIYFDFGSDRMRAASEPVLEEIADAVTRNPTWKLSVEGHTDNIGGDAHNMDLSKRRAGAVKRALVERYGVAANRLTTAGFGVSHPKESNETLAGRARNRRVELLRH
jgi:outer membrane protein OmpA-like peptidoglycan-associated protein